MSSSFNKSSWSVTLSSSSLSLSSSSCLADVVSGVLPANHCSSSRRSILARLKGLWSSLPLWRCNRRSFSYCSRSSSLARSCASYFFCPRLTWYKPMRCLVWWALKRVASSKNIGWGMAPLQLGNCARVEYTSGGFSALVTHRNWFRLLSFDLQKKSGVELYILPWIELFALPLFFPSLEYSSPGSKLLKIRKISRSVSAIVPQ